MDLQHAGTLASFLDNYWARSQVFRTVQFSSAMLSGFIAKPCPECGQKLMTVSNAISNMRVMLRLLDDLPVLVEVIKSWSNPKGDRSVLQKWAGLVNIVSTQLYYPVEHLAWAADNNLLPYNSAKLWTLGIFLWGLSLFVTILQKLKLLLEILMKRAQISSTSSEGRRSRENTSSPLIRLKLVADIVQGLCDLSIAIHWMPKGFLWGDKLPPAWWGLFGTVSSVIGLYKMSTS